MMKRYNLAPAEKRLTIQRLADQIPEAAKNAVAVYIHGSFTGGGAFSDFELGWNA